MTKFKTVYGFNFSPSGIQHGLAYKAIDEGSIDITDAYSTDGDIERYGLILLEDDLEFFPNIWRHHWLGSIFQKKQRK